MLHTIKCHHNLKEAIFSECLKITLNVSPFFVFSVSEFCTVKRKKEILFSFQISEYANRCWKACRTLARLFALALGVKMEYFEQPGFFDNPTCLLCMNHYHFPEAAKIWQNDNDPFGVKPHLDSGIFTLLMSDGVDGLERCINRKVAIFEIYFNIKKRYEFHCEMRNQNYLLN